MHSAEALTTAAYRSATARAQENQMTKILVTGATGTIGRQVAQVLLDRKTDVRVAVRDERKAQDLKDEGAELVTYDIEKDVGLNTAFEGVQRLFLLTPFVPGFEALTQKAIDAAKR
ncbi:MAG: NmrA family NAD(P)-binding protein, partial [Myxococcota bacterium]